VYRLGYVQALKMLKIAAKPTFLGYYAAKMDDQFIRSIIHRLAYLLTKIRTVRSDAFQNFRASDRSSAPIA
jgi:hypothetical protein